MTSPIVYARYVAGADGFWRAPGRPPVPTVVTIDDTTVRVSAVTAFAVGGVVTPPPVLGDRNANVGSLPPGQATYPVPTTGVVKFVAPGGSDTAAGGEFTPYATLQRAINAVGQNATIVMREGSYNEGGAPGTADLGVTIGTGKEGLTIQSYPGEEVWLEGSAPVTGWTADTTSKPGSTIWRVPYSTSFDRSVQFARGSADGTTVGYIWLNNVTSDPFYKQGKIANYYDQVFTVNGVGTQTRLIQVETLAEVVPGTFYVAGALRGGTGSDRMVFNATTLYIGTNPSGLTVRAANKTRALCVVADNCTVRGIGIRRYSPSNCDGAALSFRRTGGKAENVFVTDIAAIGIDAYLNTRVGPTTLNRVTASWCGLNGVHVEKADDFRMTDAVLEYNNCAHWMLAPAAGGIKITTTVRATIKGGRSSDNWADGYWCDASVFDLTQTGTDSQRNQGHGIEYEISAKALIADNLVTDNGKSGILIRCSDATRMWNNTCVGNKEVNLDVTQDDRRIDTGVFGQDGRHPSGTDPVYGTIGMDWIIQSVEFKNNVASRPNPSGGGGNLRIRSQPKAGTTMPSPLSLAALGPNVNGNVWGRPNSSSPAIGWALTSTGSGAVGYTTFAAYKAAGTAVGVTLDANGIAFENTDPVAADFSLTPAAESAAAAVARPLPSDVAAAVGQPAGSTHLGCWL